MSDLLRPGDHRADGVLDDVSVLADLVRVEQAWLNLLVERGVAPAEASTDLRGLVGPADLMTLTCDAESGGNVVIPLIALLRSRLRDAAAARWLHRGLTSQDVLDTALALGVREAGRRILADVDRQVLALLGLAQRHRGDVQVARTLTQHAVPTTFGAVVAGWLHGVLDAAEDLTAAVNRLPVQLGGAAGTLAAPVALGLVAADRPGELAADFAHRLDLAPDAPWHTRRRPLTRAADALVAGTDAWGKIAADILVRSRPEIGELAEPAAAGRGDSSTMPHKANPVLSTLVRSSATTAPLQAAQLHLAAASAQDERPAGAWHSEWPALRTLARTAVTAASLATELVEGLIVDPERMAAHAAAAQDDLLAEIRTMAALLAVPPPQKATEYLGAVDALIDEAAARATGWLRRTP